MASISYVDDDDRGYDMSVARSLDAGDYGPEDDRWWTFTDVRPGASVALRALLIGCALGAFLWSLVVYALVLLLGALT